MYTNTHRREVGEIPAQFSATVLVIPFMGVLSYENHWAILTVTSGKA